MKKITTGQIYRLFKSQDENTIIRKTNMRTHCKNENIDHTICQTKWLIDFNKFYESVNSKHITESVKMPRLRTKATAIKEWNSKHRTKIKHHIIDVLRDSKKVFFYKHGKYNIFNYDELEQVIIKTLKARNKY